MNFGDPNEFELIPSDSDRMEAVVGNNKIDTFVVNIERT